MASDTRSRQGATQQQTGDQTGQSKSVSRDDAMQASRRGDMAHASSYSPFSLMRQGLDEMDRWFSRFTGWNTSPGLSASRSAREWMSSIGDLGEWAPAIEAFQRGNEFVVRADVPGMTRHDLNVEIGDDTLTISGERKTEQQNEREGMYWTERSYGSFCRTIPLPQGAITDSAKANFNNGVLEVVIPAPSQEARRGRKVDISGAESK